MVFKVKQRGKTNYFEKIINTNSKTDIPTSLAGEGLGAALSKKGVQETDFLGGGSTKGANTIESEETIGYNWPYDFFSLVELVSIEEDVGFSQPTEQPQATEVDEAVAEAKAFATVQEAIAENLGEPLTQDGVQFDFGDGQKAYANVQEAIADGKNQALTQAGVASQFGVPKQVNQSMGNNLSRDGVQSSGFNNVSPGEQGTSATATSQAQDPSTTSSKSTNSSTTSDSASSATIDKNRSVGSLNNQLSGQDPSTTGKK